MKALALVILIVAVIYCCNVRQAIEKPYLAEDFTPENQFTENIEGPCFREGKLFVVNFQTDGTIGVVNKDGKTELFVTLPEGSVANAIQFDESGNMLLADWKGHNILRVEMATKKVEVFVHDDRFNQPNDICINKGGQLFASDPNWSNGTGQLWRIDPNGAMVLLEENMGTTNGIEMSPDEKTLYVNESLQRKIWSYQVDDRGNISGKTLFAEFPDHGFDGMKCDREGNLYVTRYGKGTIAVLNPAGKIIQEVPMKGLKTSNIAFGGQDGRTCFVTLQDRKCIEIFHSEVPGKNWNQ